MPDGLHRLTAPGMAHESTSHWTADASAASYSQSGGGGLSAALDARRIMRREAAGATEESHWSSGQMADSHWSTENSSALYVQSGAAEVGEAWDWSVHGDGNVNGQEGARYVRTGEVCSEDKEIVARRENHALVNPALLLHYPTCI